MISENCSSVISEGYSGVVSEGVIFESFLDVTSVGCDF